MSVEPSLAIACPSGSLHSLHARGVAAGGHGSRRESKPSVSSPAGPAGMARQQLQQQPLAGAASGEYPLLLPHDGSSGMALEWQLASGVAVTGALRPALASSMHADAAIYNPYCAGAGQARLSMPPPLPTNDSTAMMTAAALAAAGMAASAAPPFSLGAWAAPMQQQPGSGVAAVAWGSPGLLPLEAAAAPAVQHGPQQAAAPYLAPPLAHRAGQPQPSLLGRSAAGPGSPTTCATASGSNTGGSSSGAPSAQLSPPELASAGAAAAAQHTSRDWRLPAGRTRSSTRSGMDSSRQAGARRASLAQAVPPVLATAPVDLQVTARSAMLPLTAACGGNDTGVPLALQQLGGNGMSACDAGSGGGSCNSSENAARTAAANGELMYGASGIMHGAGAPAPCRRVGAGVSGWGVSRCPPALPQSPCHLPAGPAGDLAEDNRGLQGLLDDFLSS